MPQELIKRLGLPRDSMLQNISSPSNFLQVCKFALSNFLHEHIVISDILVMFSRSFVTI